jgi:hypothetical protein
MPLPRVKASDSAEKSVSNSSVSCSPQLQMHQKAKYYLSTGKPSQTDSKSTKKQAGKDK